MVVQGAGIEVVHCRYYGGKTWGIGRDGGEGVIFNLLAYGGTLVGGF